MQPSVDDVRRVMVCGAGAMGSQIGAVFALAGYETTVQDIDEVMLDKAREELRYRLNRNVEKGRMSAGEVEEAFARLSFTTEIEEPARDADLVVEAVVEKLDVKRELFSRLDGAAPEHTILATNSSTIVSSHIADVTSRPDRVCNLHFFNPALVMECVEVVRNPETSDATADTVAEISRRIGKDPVVLEQEISGFVANRILGALTNEAVSLYESGIASFEDIDTACKKALGHPIGPFALMDLTGIDVNYYVRMARYEESGDETQKPKDSITERFERGEYGRKSGKGWYEYR